MLIWILERLLSKRFKICFFWFVKLIWELIIIDWDIDFELFDFDGFFVIKDWLFIGK